MNTVDKKINIVIADDHILSRTSLNIALKQSAMFNIVGEAENGNIAIDMCLTHHPDIVLMDIGMPVQDGIAATEIIKKATTDIKIIMLTSLQGADDVKKAILAGADGYCLKKIKTENLIKVIEIICHGGVYLDPEIARHVLLNTERIKTGSNLKKSLPLSDQAQLSPTMNDYELNMFRFYIAGKSYKDIAKTFHISVQEVTQKISLILSRFNIKENELSQINLNELIKK